MTKEHIKMFQRDWFTPNEAEAYRAKLYTELSKKLHKVPSPTHTTISLQDQQNDDDTITC